MNPDEFSNWFLGFAKAHGVADKDLDPDTGKVWLDFKEHAQRYRREGEKQVWLIAAERLKDCAKPEVIQGNTAEEELTLMAEEFEEHADAVDALNPNQDNEKGEA